MKPLATAPRPSPQTTRQVFASVAAAPHLPTTPLSIPAAPIKQVKNAMKTLQALTTALKNTNLYSEEATHPRDAHQQVLTGQHCPPCPTSALCSAPPSHPTPAAAAPSPPPPPPPPPHDGGSDAARGLWFVVAKSSAHQIRRGHCYSIVRQRAKRHLPPETRD